MRKFLLILFLLISAQAWALPNDKYGRTVTGPVTANGLDTYTVSGANTFQMSFTAGTSQAVVYVGLESQAPPAAGDFVCLDSASIVLSVQHKVTTAMMDALVPGTCASYQPIDPGFPPPPIGATFNPGVGSGNFSAPIPYLPNVPSNWPNPPPLPSFLQQGVDRLANRLATLNIVASARALNSTFTPGPIRHVLGCYTIRLGCTVTVGGTCTGTVQLVSDNSTPPTTVRTQTTLSMGGTLVVGLTLTESQDVPLCYIVPAAANVRLNSVTTAGSPTFSIIQQVEEVLFGG